MTASDPTFPEPEGCRNPSLPTDPIQVYFKRKRKIFIRQIWRARRTAKLNLADGYAPDMTELKRAIKAALAEVAAGLEQIKRETEGSQDK